MYQQLVIVLALLSLIGSLNGSMAGISGQIKRSESGILDNSNRNNLAANCQLLIDELKTNPDWLTRLYDPIINSPEELDDQINAYSDIFHCLTRAEGPLTDEQQSILRLTGFFLIFADGLYASEGSSTLQLVDLSIVDDPGIERIRYQTGIPPPPGYVFVRTYASREAMPPPIRQIYEDLNVAGVTMFTRYIAVLDEQKTSWPERSLQAQSLPRTISHELVHTYVNSNLGIQAINALPTWYHEGIAIYFSRSGENQAIITPNFTLYTTPPPAYVQYDLNFKYLEAMLGKDQLQERIRLSVDQGLSSILLEELDITADDQLPERALSWQAEQDRIRTWGGTIVLLIIAYLVISGQANQIKVLNPTASCEACGSIFWLWNKSNLHQHSPPLRVWMEGDLGPEYPYSKHVHQVCQECVDRSKKVRQAYESRVRKEYSIDTESAANIYREWLYNAPKFDGLADQNTQTIAVEDAIDTFVDAALGTKYSPPWHNLQSNFQFVGEDTGDDQDFIDSPPASYWCVIQKFENSHGAQGRIKGSVYKNDRKEIVIAWQDAEKHLQSLSP